MHAVISASGPKYTATSGLLRHREHHGIRPASSIVSIVGIAITHHHRYRERRQRHQ
ncbi:MAG TPA: hypothetical protein VFS30_06250 [Dehalococcoidia bacterium]|nr:hypothetical protein [Dehalococcoidia bacterium]